MKTRILVLCSLILGLWDASLKADDSSNPLGTIASTLNSERVESDGQVYSHTANFQTELTLSLGSRGFYLYLEDFQNLNGQRNYGNEIDYNLGWSYDGIVSIDIGVGYYDVIPLLHGPSEDIYVTYATLAKSFDKGDKGTFKPFVTVTTYKTGRGSDYEGGVRVQSGVTYSRKVGKANLEATTSLVRDDGTFGYPSAWVATQTLSLSWKWGKVSVKLPTVTAYLPLSSRSGRQMSLVYGAGISF